MRGVSKEELPADLALEELKQTGVKVRLIGEDGNAFMVLGKVRAALRGAGYGQEFLMNTLGVRGMALTQTLLKYNDAAEDAARIKGIGLDADRMADINRELQVTQAQLGQLTMAGGALLAPLAGEFLPGLTEGLAETARLIAENREGIVAAGTTILELMAVYKTMQALQKAADWGGSFRAAAAEAAVLTKAQEAAIARRLNLLKAAQKKEEQLLAKEVAARKIAEAEKEQAINEGCVRIQMKYAETAARIEAGMRAAFQRISAEAKLSAAGQVQAIASTGNAAQAAGAKMVAASAAARGAAGSLAKSVWALVGGWYAVAAAVAFAFEKLVAFKREKSGEITGGLYVGGQQYRRGKDGAFYRQTVNTEAEDAFDTYTETRVTDEAELAEVREAYLRKQPAKSTAQPAAADTEKYRSLFGASAGGSGSPSGKGSGQAREELEQRKQLQRGLQQEYAARLAVRDAMRESADLQAAYLTASEKAAYQIGRDHEQTVDAIRKRWSRFETEYLGMSDTEREKFAAGLQAQGVAFEILEDGRLTDNTGRTISFKNTIVVMTSNAGAHQINENRSLGFGAQAMADVRSYEMMKDAVMKEVKEVFRPEFVNRLDELIVFHSLSEEEIRSITNLMLRQVSDLLSERKVTMSWDEEVVKYLATTGYDPKFGARPLRRLIQRTVEDTISEELLQGHVQLGETLRLHMSEDLQKIEVAKQVMIAKCSV